MKNALLFNLKNCFFDARFRISECFRTPFLVWPLAIDICFSNKLHLHFAVAVFFYNQRFPPLHSQVVNLGCLIRFVVLLMMRCRHLLGVKFSMPIYSNKVSFEILLLQEVVKFCNECHFTRTDYVGIFFKTCRETIIKTMAEVYG